MTVSWISFVIDPTVRYRHNHDNFKILRYFCQPERSLPTSHSCFHHKNHDDDDDDEGGAGEDVPARHSLPRHHQRLQQCQVSGHPDSMRKNPTKECQENVHTKRNIMTKELKGPQMDFWRSSLFEVYSN